MEQGLQYPQGRAAGIIHTVHQLSAGGEGDGTVQLHDLLCPEGFKFGGKYILQPRYGFGN